MRFFATRQTESGTPYYPMLVAGRPEGYVWGGGATLAGRAGAAARRLASMPPRDPRAAPTTCSAFLGPSTAASTTTPSLRPLT